MYHMYQMYHTYQVKAGIQRFSDHDYDTVRQLATAYDCSRQLATAHDTLRQLTTDCD